MKKFLLIILVSICTLAAKDAPKWSIVDIYSMAQKASVAKLDYPIYHQMTEKEKWVSITTAWNTFIDATVDIKNNYIYILDEGTGGGSFTTQAALWRDEVGTPLLIVSENVYDESFPERTHLKAFRYQPISGYARSLGIKLVSPPIRRLSLFDFVPEGMHMKDLRILDQIQTTIFYKLPRKGTSIHALLIVKDELQYQSILKDCYYDKKTCEKLKKAYRYYYKNLKGKIYRDIELRWNGDEFKVKEKSRKEPSKNDI